MDAGGQRVPVIFMTGQAELPTELYERYPELRETLRKPFDPDRLIRRVSHHMRASSEARSISTSF
jgi:DNA-binding response OmpR family regulator